MSLTPFAPFLLAQDTPLAGGLIAGLLFICGLIVAAVWICFPFIVNGKLNSLIHEARAARAEAVAAAKEANFYLKAMSDRMHGEKTGENVQRPTPNSESFREQAAQRPMAEKADEVYRI